MNTSTVIEMIDHQKILPVEQIIDNKFELNTYGLDVLKNF